MLCSVPIIKRHITFDAFSPRVPYALPTSGRSSSESRPMRLAVARSCGTSSSRTMVAGCRIPCFSTGSSPRNSSVKPKLSGPRAGNGWKSQGTRLIGIYDSQVAFAQSRVLLVWTRLIMPNGRSIVLERQPGADTAGYAGLEDEVDNHWRALFKARLLSTLLGVGSQLGTTTGTGTNGDVITALRRGSSDILNQTGPQVVQ